MVRAADLEYFESLNQARAERQAHGLCAASVFGGHQVPEGPVVSSEAVPPPPSPQQQQQQQQQQMQQMQMQMQMQRRQRQPQPLAALPPLAPPPAAPPSAAPQPAAPPAPEPAEAVRPPLPRPPAYAPPPAAAREPSRAPESLRVREISANPSDTELERAALAAQYAVASVAPNGETRIPPPVRVEVKPDAENGVERLDRSEVDELMLRMEGMLDNDEGFCDDDGG